MLSSNVRAVSFLLGQSARIAVETTSCLDNGIACPQTHRALLDSAASADVVQRKIYLTGWQRFGEVLGTTIDVRPIPRAAAPTVVGASYDSVPGFTTRQRTFVADFR